MCGCCVRDAVVEALAQYACVSYVCFYVCAYVHVNVCLCGCSPSKGPSSSGKKDDDGEEIIISEECTDSALLLLERLSRDKVGARGLAEQAMCSEPVVECVAVAWWGDACVGRALHARSSCVSCSWMAGLPRCRVRVPYPCSRRG